jgi:hypothetical protein
VRLCSEREDFGIFQYRLGLLQTERKRVEIRAGGIISAKRRANKVGRWKIFINKSAPHALAPPSLMSRAKLFFPRTLSPDVFVRAKAKLQKLQGKSKKWRNLTPCSNPDKFPLVIFIRRGEKLCKLLLKRLPIKL